MNLSELRCEYLVNPLGIDVTEPRLSWTLDSSERGDRQTAWQILAASTPVLLAADAGDRWDSGKVVSAETVQIPYGGRTLGSRDRCHWKVRVWDQAGEPSAWSEPGFWTMGLLRPEDWLARWIGAPAHNDAGAGPSDSSDLSDLSDRSKGTAPPLPWLRKTFSLGGRPAHAAATVNACGYYELYVNGRKADDHAVSPAVCDFSKRSLCITHDITHLVVPGKNCVALWLGRGWYVPGIPGVVHDGPIVRAQIDIAFADGRTETVGTDATWKTRSSPITPLGSAAASDFGGERFDAARELDGWNRADLDDSGWDAVAVIEPPAVPAIAQACPPNRVHTTLSGQTVETLAPGDYLVDMGRHFTGLLKVRLRDTVPGQRIDFEYVDQRRPAGLVAYGQRDEYLARGAEQETAECRFNSHASRWVRVTGLRRPPKPDDFTGLAVSTDNPPAADFHCSNDLLNRLWQTVAWTYRCVSLGGYVVDCPHRERLGYGGDAQCSMETGLTMFDTAAHYTKWLGDWRDAQNQETGDVPHVAPFPYAAGGGPPWGGICVTLPWQLYVYFGDTRALETMYPTICRWLDFLETNTRDGLLEHYGHPIWGFLGDWLQPGTGQGPGERIDENSTRFFNNCYYLYNLQVAARIARVLGRADDAAPYEHRAATLATRTHNAFFNRDKNTYACGDQPYLAFPLLIGLVPVELRGAVMANLEHDILVTQKGHLNAGMFGMYYMLKLLMREDRNDLAYTMVNQTTYPGWGWMLGQGATTIWEQWDGLNSQIHDTFLTVGWWLLQALGGIQPDETAPGFRNVLIRPGIGPGLEYARAEYRSIRGPIVSAWRVNGGRLELEVQIPANTTATVRIPTSRPESVTASGDGPRARSYAKPTLRVLRTGDGRTVGALCDIASGRYRFASEYSA